MISIKLIARHIGHDSSVGVCFAKNISNWQDAIVSVMFARSTVGGAPVGLVLVFAATRRQMALRYVS